MANITLLLPPAEAAQLAAAAASAVAAASGNADQALLSMVYPTAAGPLAVLYRSIQISNAPPAAAAAAGGTSRRHLLQVAGPSTTGAYNAAAASAAALNAAFFNSQLLPLAAEAGSSARHLLQTASAPEAAAAAAAAGPTVCIGSIQGMGLSGRNICFVPQQPGDALPPGAPCCVSQIVFERCTPTVGFELATCCSISHPEGRQARARHNQNTKAHA
jgi:hypothetical protein